MQSLTHHVCHHSNVVVYAGHGQWWLSRALGPPKKLVEQEGGQHTRLHNGNEWLVHNTEVVFVEDYEHGMCSMLEPVGCPLWMYSQLLLV